MKKTLFLLLMLTVFWLTAQETSKEFQDKLNKEYGNKEESPLTDEDFKVFKGLDFYPINEKFIVEAQFTRTPNEKVFKMKTSTSRAPEYVKYGELLFTIDGKDFKLNLYQNIELNLLCI